MCVCVCVVCVVCVVCGVDGVDVNELFQSKRRVQVTLQLKNGLLHNRHVFQPNTNSYLRMITVVSLIKTQPIYILIILECNVSSLT